MLDTKVFLAAIDELETSSGIAREITIQALKEAFESVFKKKNYEDTVVEVEIKPEEGEINIFVIKKIVEDVMDDNLEVSLEEALEMDPYAVLGGELKIKNEIDEFTKADAIKFKSILKQKIKEAEKAAIYATYSDKTGELINGVVEKVEPRYTIVNIGRTSVTLSDQHKIGDEQFQVGQTLKVYLSEVNSSTGGPQIRISRSEPGFLKRLFEEEIPEIFDGTVVIKGVARRAGDRSKVSVDTTDDSVDPIGACIGQAGTKIQKICQQLGKEKIDIVQYHEYPGSFIAEALKPATVLGVKLNEEEHSAIAVVKNDDLRVAIGKKGINAVLAVELTRWKIDIKEQDEALAEGIDYETIEEMSIKDKGLALARRNEASLLRAKEQYAARVQEELENSTEEVEEEIYDEEEIEDVNDVSEEIEEVEEVEEVKAPVVEETPVVEEVKVEYNPVRMNKGFSLSSLEKQIEDEKKKKSSQPAKKKFYKNDKDEEEVKEEKEESAIVKTEPKNYMPIYTEEEEEEFEDYEEEYEDDDRFDEYDSDDYYDEK